MVAAVILLVYLGCAKRVFMSAVVLLLVLAWWSGPVSVQGQGLCACSPSQCLLVTQDGCDADYKATCTGPPFCGNCACRPSRVPPPPAHLAPQGTCACSPEKCLEITQDTCAAGYNPYCSGCGYCGCFAPTPQPPPPPLPPAVVGTCACMSSPEYCSVITENDCAPSYTPFCTQSPFCGGCRCFLTGLTDQQEDVQLVK